MNKSIVREKSFKFALSIINLNKQLCSQNEYVISKQLLRSGTSVGANIREAQNAFSRKDFIFKLNISQKECDESIYWLELLYESNYIDQFLYKKLKNDAEELMKILKSIIITTRKKV